MVHGLEEIHRLLKPDASLVDIHPIPIAPLIEVYQGGRLVFAEPVPAYDDEDERAAEDALARVLQRRLFVVEREAAFDFLTYGSSVAQLRDFLVEQSAFAGNGESVRKWEVERAEFARRVDEIMRAAGEGAEVAFHERGRIARLRRI